MEKEINSDSLRLAFWTAWLFSGDASSAELAVLDALDGCQDISRPDFFVGIVKSAIRRKGTSSSSVGGLQRIPSELRRIISLQSQLRHCFVLRVLLGLSPEICAELLSIAIPELENAAHAAMRELSRASVAVGK